MVRSQNGTAALRGSASKSFWQCMHAHVYRTKHEMWLIPGISSVLDIISKVSIYRNIGVSMYRFKLALPPMPRRRPRVFYPRHYGKIFLFQVSNIEIVLDVRIFLSGCRYRMGFDYHPISDTTVVPYQYIYIISTVKAERAAVRSCVCVVRVSVAPI